MSRPKITLRPANSDDATRLQEIRKAAFEPIFTSFRSILGDEIYELAQEKEDREQEALLFSLLAPESGWDVFTAELTGLVIGFISVQLNRDTYVGEIGLNAIHPDYTGRGFGTTMYNFAVEQMRQGEMRVATVATGGDPSHAPARQAYRKAGFSVEISSVWMCQAL
ncbi:MAG: GNAT family N-acetyltransferase [Cyanobacteria bacterium P01_H01_bin.15]